MSDASTFDEICTLCGATDQVPGGWGQLAYPCPNAEEIKAARKLTKEQKLALIKYVSGYSTKAILEDVDEVGEEWTEENDEELRNSIENFLDEAFYQMKRRVTEY